jgi:hypothetical protein
MPAKKKTVKCSYCERRKPFIYKKDKKGNIVWSACFHCFKRFFDSVLGSAGDGGRISDLVAYKKGVVQSDAPAIKCSYCRKIIQDEDKHDMGFETDDWAVCAKCVRKAFDNVFNDGGGG